MSRRTNPIKLLLSALLVLVLCGFARISSALAEVPSANTLSIGDAPQLSFLYLDKDQLDEGDSQNVVIGLPDEVQIASASLNYCTPSSEVISIDASSIVSSTALFSFTVEDLGEYQLDSVDLTWSTNGASLGSGSIDLSSTSNIDFICDASLERYSYSDQLGEVTTYSSDISTDDIDVEEEALKVTDSVVLMSGRASVPESQKIVVALDPGHGGYDPGAVANGLRESDINLKIALAARDQLESYGYYKVVMTRSSDVYVDLYDRVDIAAAAGADVFMSIHINSASVSGAYGAEVWIPNNTGYLNEQTHGVSETIANSIIKKLEALGLYNRGIHMKDHPSDHYEDGSKADYYAVIRAARKKGIPAYIVEHAFITNPSDASKLASSAFLKKLGIADATGLAEVFSLKCGEIEAPEMALVGKPVELSAENVKGNIASAKYNFAWSYMGGWDDWGSAIKETGDYVQAPSYTFTPDKTGHYKVWYDVEINGKVITSPKKDVLVTDWSLAGVDAPASGVVGEPVEFSAEIEGDPEGLTYSYAWSYGGGWDLWGSTLKDEGAMTEETSGSFTPTRVGEYQVWVDVRDADGNQVTSGRQKVEVSGEPIAGKSSVSVDDMVNLFNSKGRTYPADVFSSKGASTINEFCQLVYEESTSEGIRAEVLFSQAMLETGWLQFGGDVKPEQCNFGGIGAVGSGASGAVFPDVRTGLRAQVQHLKAYANTEPLNNPCVDPRFSYVSRGSAPYIQSLTGKWASSPTYATSICNILYQLI